MTQGRLIRLITAAWKIIKTWLPAGAVKKIKFLTKSNIGEYVNEDQRPPQWGGLNFHTCHIFLMPCAVKWLELFNKGLICSSPGPAIP